VLKGIRVFKSGDNVGVEINADKRVEYTCTKMPQLLKVLVDLPRTELGSLDTVYRYKSVIISNIRLERKTVNGVMITRVSVNLTEDADFKTQTDPEGKKITVFFRKPAPGSSAVAAPPGNAGVKGQPAAWKAPAPVAPVAKAAAKHENNQPITVTEVVCGVDSIEIKAGGSIGEFKAFTLHKPGRLVIDLPAAQTTLGKIAIPANRFGISKVRISPFEGKLRMVFDTGSKPFPGYDVLKTQTGLRVVLQ
jgi:hypothetical protein